MRVAYVRGSVLLRQGDNRLHPLSAGRGDGSAERERSVIYDCHVVDLLYSFRLVVDLLWILFSACCTTNPEDRTSGIRPLHRSYKFLAVAKERAANKGGRSV